MGEANGHLWPLIRKLESIAPVSDAENRAIAALPVTLRDLKADQDIVRDQDRPSQCCAILEGFACRYKLLPGGRRQMPFTTVLCPRLFIVLWGSVVALLAGVVAFYLSAMPSVRR